MEKHFSLKRFILGCIVFAMGLMTLLTLCTSIVAVDEPYVDSLISAAGADISTFENGFMLFDFDSSAGMDYGAAIGGGILSIFILLLSLSTMAFAVLSIFFFKDKTAKRIVTGHAIGCLVMVFMYMLFGVILVNTAYCYVNISSNGWWYLRKYASNSYDVLSFETYTTSYLGFIFVALEFIALVLCRVYVKDDIKLGKKNMARVHTQTTTIAGSQKICANCGMYCPEQSKFCIKCGTPFAEIQEQPKPTHEAPVEMVPSVQPQVSAEAPQQSENAAKFTSMKDIKTIAEALKTYKELLDAGILTQAEFDEKKKEILG